MGIFLGLARFWSIVFFTVLAGFACANQYSVGPSQTYSTITACLAAIDGTYGNTCSLDVASTTYTISGANSYDIREDAGTVIRVGADDVTLDCSGSDFTGNGTGAGLYSNGFDGATIQNCEFDGYHNGIALSNTTDATISGNTVLNMGGNGISAADGSNSVTISGNTIDTTTDNGINVYKSTSARVTNNNIKNAGANGIDITDESDSATVSGNAIDTTHDNGINAYKSTTVNFTNNNVTNTGENGIDITDESDSATVSGNKINTTHTNGINVYKSAAAKIVGNTVNVTLNHHDGIGIGESSSANVSNNDVENVDGLGGIGFYSSPAGTASHNTVENSTHNGMWITGSPNALITYNTVSRTEEVGIAVYDGDDSANVSGNTVNATGSNGISVYKSTTVNFTNNNVTNAGANGIDFSQVPHSMISGNTVLDSGGKGIVFWEGSNLSTVFDNTVNATDDDGISIHDSHSVNVSNNQVDNANGLAGIGFYSALSGTASHNSIENSTHNGMWTDSSSNLVISTNTVRGSGDNGIVIYNGGSDYSISGNTVYATAGGGGIFFLSGLDSSISGNTVYATAGGPGILLSGSSSNNVTGNNVSNNDYFAVQVSDNSDGNLVKNNVFAHNGAAAEDYLISNSPRSYDGTDYADVWEGTGLGLFLFSPASLGDYTEALSDDQVASPSPLSYHNGTASLNLGLITGPTGNSTMLFDDSVATNCGELETYLDSFFDDTFTCNYFEPHVFIANGYGNDYTSNFSSSTDAVSGFISPPSLIYGPSTASGGGVSIEASSNNTVTGNTFSYNWIGIAVRSGCWNSVSGNSLASSNSIPLYLSKSVCGVALSNVPVSSAAGDYVVNASSSSFQASNSMGVIRWSFGNVPVRNNLGQNLIIGAGAAALNSSLLPELNTSSQVTFYGVNCRSFTLYHSNGFYTLLADIIANGAQVADQSRIGGNCTDSSICRNVQCTGTTLTFLAMHFDSYGADSGAVPEFTGFAAFAALLFAAAGFFAVRRAKRG